MRPAQVKERDVERLNQILHLVKGCRFKWCPTSWKKFDRESLSQMYQEMVVPILVDPWTTGTGMVVREGNSS